MAGETQSSDDNRLQGMYTGEEADILSSFFILKLLRELYSGVKQWTNEVHTQ